MKEKDVIMAALNALSKMSTDFQVQSEKRYEKMFTPIKTDASLKDFLSTFTKSDLDDIRQNFELTGVSSLKKAELIDVLNINIKDNLFLLINKLTNKDYKFILNTIKNEGIHQYMEEYRDTFLYLRKHGMMYGASVGDQKYFIIPKDLQSTLKLLFNDITMINKIKLNDKLLNLTKGLLYYYGVLKTTQFSDMLNSYLKEKLTSEVLIEKISEFSKKDKNICLSNNCLYHVSVKNKQLMLSEIEKRPLLNYCPINIDTLLKAADSDFLEWTNKDQAFYNYLLGNFKIDAQNAKHHIISIKLDFKNGTSYLDAMKAFSEKFNIPTIAMTQEINNLLQFVYNNTKLWVLKGYSPEEVYYLEKSKKESNLETNNSINKTGRNDSCPCGSGKKYKNCCLKSL
jgi:hypothetical protein